MQKGVCQGPVPPQFQKPLHPEPWSPTIPEPPVPGPALGEPLGQPRSAGLTPEARKPLSPILWTQPAHHEPHSARTSWALSLFLHHLLLSPVSVHPQHSAGSETPGPSCVRTLPGPVGHTSPGNPGPAARLQGLAPPASIWR